jgi:hypothetical protein
MTKEKNSTLTPNEEVIRAIELASQYYDEGHEEQAVKELIKWCEKWEHTDIGCAIDDFLIEKYCPEWRRPRGPAFDARLILTAVALLEKINSTAVAKNLAADRFCTTVRNVETYLKKHGAAIRQIVDHNIECSLKEGAESFVPEAGLRLTEEEIRKINEVIFREK